MKLFSNLALAAIVAVGAFASSTAEAGNGFNSFCKSNFSCGKNFCGNYCGSFCYPKTYCYTNYCTPSYCYPTYCQPIVVQQPVVQTIAYQPQVVYQPTCYATSYCLPTYTNYCTPSYCYSTNYCTPSFNYWKGNCFKGGCYNFSSRSFKK